MPIKTFDERDLRYVLSELKAAAAEDDGWVLVSFVEKLFNEISGVRERSTEQPWIKGWAAIGAYLGRSPGALAVDCSLDRLPIRPTYFGRTPGYTREQLDKIRDFKAGRDPNNRR